ncbi:hypothetical protein R0137_03550 [Congregibacter brevis]|uniref:FG-GAP repeat protein n=1 Tax=Congregibacter brevis TaxID=3081201 RepID=A0ABZ0IGJ9_9GAMM|nr:hypothetical protein R0137_03550 [Congregibacter sp. IMCC45268]
MKKIIAPIFAVSVLALATSHAVNAAAQGELRFEEADHITMEDVGLTTQGDAEFGFALTHAPFSLIISAPSLIVDNVRAGGIVQLKAGNDRLDLADPLVYSQATSGVPGGPEAGDRFGHAVAVHVPDPDYLTLDRVCWLDEGCHVYVGVPGEDIKSDRDAGMVHILNVHKDDTWSAIDQAQKGIIGSRESGDRFGSSIALGDFNADGGIDMAIGAPDEDTGKYENSGGVNTIMWDAAIDWDLKSNGYKAFNNEAWSQKNLAGTRVDNERFGSALATGDFNGDGTHDLAIGVPNDVDKGGLGKSDNAAGGAINVIYGKPFDKSFRAEGGLRMLGSELINQNTPGVAGGVEDGDGFGKVLAVGDFNSDGADDLAVGVPGEALGSRTSAGMVHVFYGRKFPTAGGEVQSGLVARRANGKEEVRSISFHQDRDWIEGGAEKKDYFGAALAIGDFNGDKYDDLAIGIPGEDLGGNKVEDAGAVVIINGGPSGLKTTESLWITERDIPGIGRIREGARFGASLEAGYFNKDFDVDLAIGSSEIGVGKGGSVSVVYQRPVD